MSKYQWTALNCIRTEQGRYNYLLHKWGIVESSLCDYAKRQSITHIIQICPKISLKKRQSNYMRAGLQQLIGLMNLLYICDLVLFLPLSIMLPLLFQLIISIIVLFILYSVIIIIIIIYNNDIPKPKKTNVICINNIFVLFFVI